MKEEHPLSDQQLEEKLRIATSSKPLNAVEHDRETHELRVGWQALEQAAQQQCQAADQAIDVEALWQYVQRPLAPQIETAKVTRRATASPGKALFMLAATAAAIALCVFGLWQLMDHGDTPSASQVVVEEPAQIEPLPPDGSSSEEPIQPHPETPATTSPEQLVQTPSEQPSTLQETPAPAEATSDPYAWDDGFDATIASASSAMHEIRHGWRGTSEEYRYLSNRVEDIEQTMADEPL